MSHCHPYPSLYCNTVIINQICHISWKAAWYSWQFKQDVLQHFPKLYDYESKFLLTLIVYLTMHRISVMQTKGIYRRLYDKDDWSIMSILLIINFVYPFIRLFVTKLYIWRVLYLDTKATFTNYQSCYIVFMISGWRD